MTRDSDHENAVRCRVVPQCQAIVRTTHGHATYRCLNAAAPNRETCRVHAPALAGRR